MFCLHSETWSNLKFDSYWIKCRLVAFAFCKYRSNRLQKIELPSFFKAAAELSKDSESVGWNYAWGIKLNWFIPAVKLFAKVASLLLCHQFDISSWFQSMYFHSIRTKRPNNGCTGNIWSPQNCKSFRCCILGDLYVVISITLPVLPVQTYQCAFYHLSPLSSRGIWNCWVWSNPRSHLSKVPMLHKVFLKEHNHGVSVEREREQKRKPRILIFLRASFFLLILVFTEVRSNNI